MDDLTLFLLFMLALAGIFGAAGCIAELVTTRRW
jgi:hypothetical protein